MYAWHVRDPEDLPVDLQTAESVFRQVLFLQPEKREVRQVAQHSLEPAVVRHDLADAGVLKLVDIKRQHRDVLRRARRRDRIQYRLRKIFTEENPLLPKLETFSPLL